MNSLRAQGQELVLALDQELHRSEISGRAEMREGHVANELMQRGKDLHCELLAVCLSKDEGLGRLAFGSTGKKLIFQSPLSLLIYKPGITATNLSRAVFATDHSEIAQKALDKLIQMQPRGIKEIVVLTAFPKNLTSALAPFIGQMGLDVSQLVGEKLQAENNRLAKRLQDAGFHAQAEVSGEPVHEAIAHACQKHSAGLVIVGAQGHGMLEGLVLGGVSSHQVSHTDHAVLILRP